MSYELQTASIEFRDDGTPYSPAGADCYFANPNGLAEATHTFIEGNNLPARWQHHTRSSFKIFELGFGTGMNFFATWLAWNNTAPETLWLDYYSVENTPVKLADICRIMSRWNELKRFIRPFAFYYPEPIRAFHAISFPSHRVRLNLIFNEADSALDELNELIDAWYLDGFAPEKNPGMWSQSLFKKIGQCTHANGTAATFSVARPVKDALKHADFTLAKRPGFGNKREMLAAHYASTATLRNIVAPWFTSPIALPDDREPIVVVGAGVAGMAVVAACVVRGRAVTLVDQAHHFGAAASGNPIAICRPYFLADAGPVGRFYLHAFLYAQNMLRFLDSRRYAHQECGAIEQTKRSVPTSLYPASWRSPATIGNVPDHYARLPKALAVQPVRLFKHIFEQHRDLIRLQFGRGVDTITYEDGRWTLNSDQGDVIERTNRLIIASGTGLQHLQQTAWLAQQSTRGQVTYVPAELTSRHQHSEHLIGSAYLTPSINGLNVLGASQLRDDEHVEYRSEEAIRYWQTLVSDFADSGYCPNISNEQIGLLQGRVSFRNHSRDRVPFAGGLVDPQHFLNQFAGLESGKRPSSFPAPPYLPGLGVVGGLGSRGFTTAWLAAEITVSQLLGDRDPLPAPLLPLLAPHRFLVKGLKQQKKDLLLSRFAETEHRS